MPFNHEYRQHIRAAFIGCGKHAFQSILPSFQYAPIELVAICDLVPERAQFCARQFGALRWYTDYAEMLEQEELDAVFVVLNHDAAGRPQYAPVAIERAACGPSRVDGKAAGLFVGGDRANAGGAATRPNALSR